MNSLAHDNQYQPLVFPTRRALSQHVKRGGQHVNFLAGVLYDTPPVLHEGIHFDYERGDMRRQLLREEKNAFIRENNATCAYCGRQQLGRRDPDGKPWTADHVVPLGRGGREHPSNLALACFGCNASKSYYMLDEWRAWHTAILSAVAYVEQHEGRGATISEIRQLLGYRYEVVAKRVMYLLRVGHLVAHGQELSAGTVPCRRVVLLQTEAAS